MGGPEGAAVLLGPAGRVEAWVEVVEPEGGGRVGQPLGAQRTQLQPPTHVLLHLGRPGQSRVTGVLELHVASGAQQLHGVPTTLGLGGGVGGEGEWLRGLS